MIGLPNPYLILGAIVTAVTVYFVGHNKGWNQRDAEMQAEIAIKNEESRQKEHKLTEQINQTATKLSEANDAINQKQSALNRAIAAGRVRLTSTSCVQAPANPAPPAGDSKETRSEPDRQVDQVTDAERATLAAIAEIVAQGDRNTQQLNACIDAYTSLMETFNGKQ